MTTDSRPPAPWPLDNPASLRDAIIEHGTPASEAPDLAASLARLAAWQAPVPTHADTDCLLASLSAHLPAPRLAPLPAATQPLWWAHTVRSAQVILRQPRLIHRSVWIGSALAITLIGLYAAALHGRQGDNILGVCLPIVAAAGAAFLYGREADPALEVSLAVPTSSRFILLTRSLLLVGYDLALAVVATALVAAIHGEGLSALASLWLGPLALFSAGSLLVSLVFGPFVAVVGAAMLWLAQTLDLTVGGSVRLAADPLSQTTPLTLAAAVALLVLALFYLPHRERLA